MWKVGLTVLVKMYGGAEGWLCQEGGGKEEGRERAVRPSLMILISTPSQRRHCNSVSQGLFGGVCSGCTQGKEDGGWFN